MQLRGQRVRRAFFTGLACVAALASAAAARSGYYQSPDIHGDTVVFSCEGDLWTVPFTGGEARRITSHPGVESSPRFSPDGQWIAFSGSYDGNRDLYLIPATGGEPKRLTWHPAADEPIGWTPDGKEILFKSNREDPHYC